MEYPPRYNITLKRLDDEFQGKTIKPSNLIPIILLALEIYDESKNLKSTT